MCKSLFDYHHHRGSHVTILIEQIEHTTLILKESSNVIGEVMKSIESANRENRSCVVKLQNTQASLKTMAIGFVRNREDVERMMVINGGQQYREVIVINCLGVKWLEKNIKKFAQGHMQIYEYLKMISSEKLYPPIKQLQNQIMLLQQQVQSQSTIIEQLIDQKRSPPTRLAPHQPASQNQMLLFKQAKSHQQQQQQYPNQVLVPQKVIAANNQGGVAAAYTNDEQTNLIAEVVNLTRCVPSTFNSGAGYQSQQAYQSKSKVVGGEGGQTLARNASAQLIPNLQSLIKHGKKQTMLVEQPKVRPMTNPSQAKSKVIYDIQFQRDRLRHINRSAISIQKENIHPNQMEEIKQRIKKKIELNQRCAALIPKKEEKHNEQCDLDDDELIADERDDFGSRASSMQMMPSHNLLMVRKNGLLPPSKVITHNPELHSPKIATYQDEEEDIVQLSKTQNLRKMPLNSSILLLEKNKLHLQSDPVTTAVSLAAKWNPHYFEPDKTAVDEEHPPVVVLEYPTSDIAAAERRRGDMKAQSSGGTSENVENTTPSPSSSKNKEDSSLEHFAGQHKTFLENTKHLASRRLTDLHEARAARSRSKNGSIEPVNEQGNGLGRGGPGSNHHLRGMLPLSRSISGLDETLKAVKNLLKIRKDDGSGSNLIQVNRKLRQQSLCQEEKALNIGTTILYREHKRRSLIGSKSETLLPNLKPIQIKFDEQVPPVPVQSPPHPQVVSSLLTKYSRPVSKLALQERRMQRQASTTMSFQHPPMIMSQSQHNISVNSFVLPQNENLAEFFQMYETFKAQDTLKICLDNEKSSTLNRVRSQQYLKLKRSVVINH